MKYLIPALGTFIIAMLFKYPVYMQEHVKSIEKIVLHLMSKDIRMESVGLQIGNALFEKFGVYDENFLNQFLFSTISTMHFYRNNTKQKIIPIQISKAVHTFFSTFIVNSGTDSLVQACNKI